MGYNKVENYITRNHKGSFRLRVNVCSDPLNLLVNASAGIVDDGFYSAILYNTSSPLGFFVWKRGEFFYEKNGSCCDD